MQDKLKILHESILETIWPTRCSVCGELGHLLCEKCIKKIKFINTWLACSICGEPYSKLQCCGCSPVYANLSENEKDSYKMEFDRCISVAILDKNTGSIVTSYKDGGERRLSELMAYFMYKYTPQTYIKNNYNVTFIPASKKAYLNRGFDHNSLLAKQYAQLCGLKVQNLFERPNVGDQRQLGRHEREQNLYNQLVINTNAYSILKNNKDMQNFILVDDVKTTGATLNAAAKTLHECGVKNVVCITFALTY